jgi:hypothetical protein
MPVEVTVADIIDYTIMANKKTEISEKGYISIILKCSNQEEMTLQLFFEKDSKAFHAFQFLELVQDYLEAKEHSDE